MEISCSHCQTRVNIPDEKLPKGKKVSLLCPKCKQKVHLIPDGDTHRVDAPGSAHTADTGSPGAQPQPASPSSTPTPDYDASDKPFDFLDENAKTALLCISHPQAGDTALKLLNSMGYHIKTVDTVETALTQMKYHLFNVVIFDENFDAGRKGCRRILAYLNDLDMMSRRKMVVCLLTKELRTMDNMASFHLSVNQILNLSQINGMEALLKRTIKEHDQFFGIFNESLRKLGKAT